jgi:hypothetical protein
MREIPQVTDHLIESVRDSNHVSVIHIKLFGFVPMQLIVGYALKRNLEIAAVQFVPSTLQCSSQQWRNNDIGEVPYLFCVVQVIVDLSKKEACRFSLR